MTVPRYSTPDMWMENEESERVRKKMWYDRSVLLCLLCVTSLWQSQALHFHHFNWLNNCICQYICIFPLSQNVRVLYSRTLKMEANGSRLDGIGRNSNLPKGQPIFEYFEIHISVCQPTLNLMQIYAGATIRFTLASKRRGRDREQMYQLRTQLNELLRWVLELWQSGQRMKHRRRNSDSNNLQEGKNCNFVAWRMKLN